MAERQLIVRIIGDDKSLQQAFSRSQKSTQTFGLQFANMGRTLAKSFGAVGLAIGTAELAQGLNASIDAASDLNEQVQRSRQIFDESAKNIEDWSKTTADAFGISQREALRFAGTFGLLFRNLGSSAPEAERLSKQLVELAADMASFNNVDVQTALLALRSGLTGEVEPLRKFGVFLSEARSNLQALADTGKKSTAELTTQEKVLARLALVMRDTSRTQGDFARTSDSLANQSRILDAQLDDLSTNLGQVFVPALAGAVAGLNEFIDAMEEAVISVRNLRDAIKDSSFAEFDLPPPPDWLQKFRFSDDVNRLLFGPPGVAGETLPGAKGPGQGIGEDIRRRAEESAKQAEDAKNAAERAKRRRQKAFDELVKGLGLKLDRAGLTQDLNDDLAVLREIERAILRRIKAEGRTFKLMQQLTDVQLEIQRTEGEQQAEAQRRAQEAQEKQLEAQQRADERRRQRTQRRIQRRNREQFEALGLTETGQRPTPGAGALRRRLGTIRQQVEGTFLDTAKTQRELDRIAQVLSGKFGKVGKDVREAILAMLNDISEALEGKGAKKGPLTSTTSLNTNKLLAGLGLSPEEIRALRGRLSGLNSAGASLAGVIGGPPSTASTASFGGGQGQALTGLVIEVPVYLDGQKIADVVTRRQQKAKRRNPRQKRGPNRNR